MPSDFLVHCWKPGAIVRYAKSTLLALRGSTPNLRYWPQRLKDDRLSPPKKIVVKNIFHRFIKFICPHIIVFEGVNSFVNIH